MLLFIKLRDFFSLHLSICVHHLEVFSLFELIKSLFFSLNLVINFANNSETSLVIAKSTLTFLPIEEGSIST